MSTVRSERESSDPPAPGAHRRPALRVVRSAPTRRVVSSLEHAIGLSSLMLFIGSAIAMRESVLQDADGPLFPIGCALFLLSVLLPVAAGRRS